MPLLWTHVDTVKSQSFQTDSQLNAHKENNKEKSVLEVSRRDPKILLGLCKNCVVIATCFDFAFLEVVSPVWSLSLPPALAPLTPSHLYLITANHHLPLSPPVMPEYSHIRCSISASSLEFSHGFSNCVSFPVLCAFHKLLTLLSFFLPAPPPNLCHAATLSHWIHSPDTSSSLLLRFPSHTLDSRSLFFPFNKFP